MTTDIGKITRNRVRLGLVVFLGLPMLFACGNNNNRGSRILAGDPRYGSLAGYGARGGYPGAAGGYNPLLNNSAYGGGGYRPGGYDPRFAPSAALLAQQQAMLGTGSCPPATMCPTGTVTLAQLCAQSGNRRVGKWNSTTKKFEPVDCPDLSDRDTKDKDDKDKKDNKKTADGENEDKDEETSEHKLSKKEKEAGSVSAEDPNFEVAMGFCDATEENELEGEDFDGVPLKCENTARSRGYRAAHPKFFNGIKVAAVKIPPAGKNRLTDWFKRGKQDRLIKGRTSSVDALRSILEDRSNTRLSAFSDPNQAIHMPESMNVGLISGKLLTLGGVQEGESPDEAFSVGKLPAMAGTEENLNANDGFLYFFETWLNFPTSLNPVVELRTSSWGGEDASGLVVFLNGNILVDWYSGRGAPVRNDVRTGLKNNGWCNGVNCHYAGVFYSSRKSNRSAQYLRQAMLMNIKPNDGRGYEGIPTVMTSPVPLSKKYKFPAAIQSTGPFIRIGADPSVDQGLISKCGVPQDADLIFSNEVDLTMCPMLFYAGEAQNTDDVFELLDPTGSGTQAPTEPSGGGESPTDAAASATPNGSKIQEAVCGKTDSREDQVCKTLTTLSDKPSDPKTCQSVFDKDLAKANDCMMILPKIKAYCSSVPSSDAETSAYCRFFK